MGKCLNCGKEFEKRRPNQLYCCSECCTKYNSKVTWQKKKIEKTKAKKSKPTLDEKIRRATALGMTYGKYVQAVEMGLIKG